MSDLLVAFAVLHVLLLIAAAAGQCRARVRVHLEVDLGQLETVVVVPAPLAAPPVLPPVPAPAKQSKRKLTKALKAANWKLGSTKWTASRGRQRQTGVCCERRCSETPAPAITMSWVFDLPPNFRGGKIFPTPLFRGSWRCAACELSRNKFSGVRPVFRVRVWRSANFPGAGVNKSNTPMTARTPVACICVSTASRRAAPSNKLIATRR